MKTSGGFAPGTVPAPPNTQTPPDACRGAFTFYWLAKAWALGRCLINPALRADE